MLNNQGFIILIIDYMIKIINVKKYNIIREKNNSKRWKDFRYIIILQEKEYVIKNRIEIFHEIIKY